MKTLFTLLVMMIGISSSIEAQQILFSQDFENGLGDMVAIDNDGLVVSSTLADNLDIDRTPSIWLALEVEEGNSSAVSPSWFDPVGVADDWLITPSIAIEPNTVIEWTAFAINPSFRDGYNVLVSTTDMALSSFENIFSVDAEFATSTLRQLDLSTYEGMDIFIAFQNNSDNKQALVLDDIVVRTTQDIDTRIIDLSLSETTFLDGNFNIYTGLPGAKNVVVDFFNSGRATITDLSFVLSFDGNTYTENHQVSIASGESATVTSNNTIELGVGDNQSYGINMITANGTPLTIEIEEVVTILPSVPAFVVDDSKGNRVDVHQLLAEGKTVVLDFFASWCTPCEVTTPILNSWYETNGSGNDNHEVIGIDIEPEDTEEVINSLGWGATYPKVAHGEQSELYWRHFTEVHGLNSGELPYFVMICPNLGVVTESPVIASQIGVPRPPSFDFWQPDLDACVSRVTDVDEIAGLLSLSMYPNPANSIIAVSMEMEKEMDISLSIIDYSGKEMMRVGEFHTSVLNLDMDTSELPSGMYLLQIISEQGISTQRFAIQK